MRFATRQMMRASPLFSSFITGGNDRTAEFTVIARRRSRRAAERG